ncbi:hypothetical protein BH10CHL1_BH10CHL1_00870 [soil metagenome]
MNEQPNILLFNVQMPMVFASIVIKHTGCAKLSLNIL